MGAPELSLQLLVDPQSKHMTGFGHITQPVHPPLEFTTQLEGEFRELSVQNLHLIIVTSSGYSPAPAGITLPNLQLLMALSDDWKSGTAEYEYKTHPEDSHWQIIRDVEVISIPCETG